jgi:para-nitrobenzyl esterase
MKVLTLAFAYRRFDTMTRWIRFFTAVVLLTCLTGCQTPTSSPDDLTIQVDGGLISGTLVGSDGQIRAYKGIPYAAPPVGDWRWKPPQPVTGWNGVREAHQFSPVCPQPIMAPSILESSVGNQEKSEDCLYLNVWTGAASSDERRPVMVWIHGGGLFTGSGSRSMEDGAALARKGAVLVTINYRLGPLGYLAHPELTAESEHNSSGNYGLLDQIAALQWVQQNIASFGGDPNRVTIFGVSRGASSVYYLVATPLAKGLFHQAIGQSGNVFQPMAHLKEAPLGVGPAEAIGTRFAADLEADEESSALEVMRGKTAQEIIDTFYSSLFRSGRPIPLLANVDGWVLSDQVYEIFARGEQNDVPIIVGSNANDGTVLLRPGQTFSQQVYQDRAREKYEHLSDEFFALYPVGSDEEAREAFLGETRGENFTWGMRTWARMMKNVSSEAYLYFFSRVPPGAGTWGSQGSYHGAEIPYAFNNLDAMDWTLEETDVQLSRMMSEYWLNFASTGDPNGEGLPLWAPYRLEEEPYMHFGDTVEPGSDGFLNREVNFFDRYFTWRRSR